MVEYSAAHRIASMAIRMMTANIAISTMPCFSRSEDEHMSAGG